MTKKRHVIELSAGPRDEVRYRTVAGKLSLDHDVKFPW